MHDIYFVPHGRDPENCRYQSEFYGSNRVSTSGIMGSLLRASDVIALLEVFRSRSMQCRKVPIFFQNEPVTQDLGKVPGFFAADETAILDSSAISSGVATAART